MIKMLLIFVLLTAIIAAGFELFTELTNSEKYSVLKIIGYSAACSIVALVLLTFIVILF